MRDKPEPMKRRFSQSKWAALVTIMVSLVIFLCYLLKEFQQALHDIPN